MASSARTITARVAQLLRTPTRKASFFSTPVARRHVATDTFSPRRQAPKPSSVPRNFRSASTSPSGSSNTGLYATILVLGTVGGSAYYLHSTGQLANYFPFISGAFSGSSSQKVTIKGPDYKPTFEDYQEVYNEVAELLESNSDYDDGSYGPVYIPLFSPMFTPILILGFISKVLLRLAWHASGTYDKDTKTGGSNGATMRFSPESDHGANAGLKIAREVLEQIKRKFLHIVYWDCSLFHWFNSCSISPCFGTLSGPEV